MCDEHKHIGSKDTGISLPSSTEKIKIGETVKLESGIVGRVKGYINTKKEVILQIAFPRK